MKRWLRSWFEKEFLANSQILLYITSMSQNYAGTFYGGPLPCLQKLVTLMNWRRIPGQPSQKASYSTDSKFKSKLSHRSTGARVKKVFGRVFCSCSNDAFVVRVRKSINISRNVGTRHTFKALVQTLLKHNRKLWSNCDHFKCSELPFYISTIASSRFFGSFQEIWKLPCTWNISVWEILKKQKKVYEIKFAKKVFFFSGPPTKRGRG